MLGRSRVTLRGTPAPPEFRLATILNGLLMLIGSLIVPPPAASAQDLSVRRWLVYGPVPSDTGEARVVADYLGDERQTLPHPGSPGWVETVAGPAGRLDLNEVFEGESTAWSAAYAHTYIFSPEDRTVLLVADSDDDLVIRVNGQRVWVNEVARGLGRGSDTVTVRLARGWNSLLLKPLNRSGGFGLLARLAPAESSALQGIRLALERPGEADGHVRPAATVTVGPLLLDGPIAWEGDALLVRGRVQVSAWGDEAFRGVQVELRRSGRALAASSAELLEPGEPVSLEMSLPFEALRRAALADPPVVASTRWEGGRENSPLFVGADRLLRLVSGRIAIGPLVVDSSGGRTSRLTADLRVPGVARGSSLDLLTLGLGPEAAYTVDGRSASWDAGRVELCAPCEPGARLALEVEPAPGRPLWMMPVVRLREPGYPQYADGYDFATRLAGRSPEIGRPDPAEWLRALGTPGYAPLRRRYASAYAPLASDIRRDTLHLVGNSHIDAAWLWPWSETIDVIRDTWRTSLKLAEIFPGYVFAASSAAYYEAMDRLEPGLADSLAAAVRAGYWVPVGGWWVEADANLPSGESLVRQGLYGQRYFERRFGRRSKVAWTPDTFGYPWTLPQILREQGFEYFVTQKIRWNDSTEFPHNAFVWEGRDGTRIPTYNPYGYVHNLDGERLTDERLEDRDRTGSNHQIVLYGVGDHGGGPTIEMLQRAEDLRRIPTFPVMLYDQPYDALESVQRSVGSELPAWRDELYLEYHRGTYTTQAWTKWRNRRSESMLRTAEALAAMSAAPYPRERLEEAWRLVLFNQFHDILPGSGIPEVYRDADQFYDSAWAVLDSLTAASFADLRSRMDTRVGARAVVVFNPLGWSRSGPVTLARSDGAGTVISASDVPPLGARVIRLPRDSMAAEERRLPVPTAGPGWIENAYLRVEVDTLTGDIVRLYDKAHDREVLAAGGRGNVLQVFDDRPDQWDAWNIVLTGERWPVRDVIQIAASADPRSATMTVERHWGKSTFSQLLSLGRASRMLDVLNQVNWRERRKLLKVAFELGVDADSATFEIPYGTIGRSGRPRSQAERAKFEVPGQRWADVSADGYGVSLLNDGKYGWDYRGNVLRLSLLRSPVWPDSLADRGHHIFRFAVYPHAGDWREANTVRRAVEYNVPLLAAEERAHPGELGKAVSFASVRPENVELAWLKRAEDSDAWVLRLVEWFGQRSDAVVTLDCAVEGVRRANLIEDPRERVITTGGKTVTLNLRPYEIATLLVECQR